VNLFVAGPPLKTIVLDSAGSTFGASLSFMKLDVKGTAAKFTLLPKDEMTHFFVITCYASGDSVGTSPLALDAKVTGKRAPPDDVSGALVAWPLNHITSNAPALPAPSGVQPHRHSALQLLQPLLGYSEYEVVIATMPPTPTAQAPNLPTIEYRLTYVPTRFTYTQICVRALFTFTSVSMLVAYTVAIFSRSRREPGQLWMTSLLILLIALNDPLYIARVMIGGNHSMYVASVLGQILFSGGLFLFWLVYADGMNSAASLTRGACFYAPKILLVGVYVVVSASMFVMHGRLPDRINMSDAHGMQMDTQTVLVVALCGSVILVGLWLSQLVLQAVYRLGWKKVEYIYTEREKSFVGITIVFVILSLCGHLYRAVHGRRGSWMQLQLPFLTLTNSYLTLLTHAFWPSDQDSTAPAGTSDSYGNDDDEFMDDDGRSKGKGLLADDDDEGV